ncbi:MAG: 4-hydroxythreonine-4-phosphate dehydrogenase PdxA [Candidatus Omnitrophica bacterium]|nr:4-hydroxythreonine-4-phosphate dehydrogenase PdxA [Candidatus Omnitrophota bacterium]
MPTSRSSKQRIVITMGDPSGIGPEVTLKALASPQIKGLADFIVVGNRFTIEKTSRELGLKFSASLMDIDNVPQEIFRYGKSHPAFGKASIQYIDKALDIIDSDDADSLVTAPINKASINSAGYKGFEGHTEYLAKKTHASNFAMMFVGKELKITLVTRHIALRDLPKKLSEANILSAIELTDRYLKKFFRISAPRIGVAGLNPHAGEGGMFGDEEELVIAPAIKKAAKHVKCLTGPVSPDVIFNMALDGKFDAVISMYHDQALIPFKLLYFNTGVNLTLGLPFVRTSPDHGTAFDIAGKGIADPSSMIEAIKLACRLSGKA